MGIKLALFGGTPLPLKTVEPEPSSSTHAEKSVPPTKCSEEGRVTSGEKEALLRSRQGSLSPHYHIGSSVCSLGHRSIGPAPGSREMQRGKKLVGQVRGMKGARIHEARTKEVV